MNYVGVTAVRDQISSLIETTERTVIMRNNEPRAVLLSIDDYRTLVLAQARQSDPEFQRRLLESHRRVMEGDLEDTVDFSEGTAEELLELAREHESPGR